MSSWKGVHYPDDEISDHGGPRAPLTVRVSTKFANREYENFVDGYFTLTPKEADKLLLAINEAQAKRQQWLHENPNGVADLKAKIAAEEEAANAYTTGWYFSDGGATQWYPGLPEVIDLDTIRAESPLAAAMIEVAQDKATAGTGVARFTDSDDPDVVALQERSR